MATLSGGTGTRAAVLRNRLIDELVAGGWIRTSEVEAAMRTVPREVFLPGVPLSDVYSDAVVALRWDEAGNCISSASAPGMVGVMLEQARLRPGDRVLEIGTATGINACYLGRLVGGSGWVTSIEILPDLVDGARRAVDAVGAGNVEVLLGDGEYGAPEAAPFDCVFVTAQAPDLATAWLDQLRPGHSRLVVPLRLRGLTRSVAFEPEGEHWRSGEMHQCAFVPMQGDGADPQRVVEFGGRAALRVDDGQPVDAEALPAAVDAGVHTIRTGVVLGAGEDALAHLDIWLAVALDSFGRFTSGGRHRSSDPFGWTGPYGTAATWDRGSLAYLALQRHDIHGRRFELVVWGHGPRRRALAESLADRVRQWNRELRGGPEPVIRAYRAGTPDRRLAAGRVVDRRNTRMVLGDP